MKLINEAWINLHVKQRISNGHKKSFGHVFVIAGSEGKAGAAILCSKAALHSGCGMVTVMIPSDAVAILLEQCPEIMYTTSNLVKEVDLNNFDAVVIGPGLGFSEIAKENLQYIIQHFKGPIVIDADGLTMLASEKHLFKDNHILTPHPGEFAKLIGTGYDENNRPAQVLQFVQIHPSVLVLKGAGTLVAQENHELLQNTTGNDGMATAGAGDVLAGIIAGIAAQGYDNFESAAIGVYLHGLAGDLAVREISKASLVASDLIHFLGKTRLLD
jgi:NAD(P)H-hydrate epimerase